VDVADARAAQALAAALRAAAPITGVVPGRASVLVEWDPLTTTADAVRRLVDAALAHPSTAEPVGRERTIPVVYGGERGPDLEDVAARLGMAPEEVVARHAAVELEVLFCGFAPGYAYLGDLPDALRVPRLATPRTRTPAGSVAIADGMTGIYPDDLPGGWPVIGWTPIRLFDPRRNPPAYLLPGDRVRFRAIAAADAHGFAAAPEDW
jgi:KipI family sensor histidine kinase inhibitor